MRIGVVTCAVALIRCSELSHSSSVMYVWFFLRNMLRSILVELFLVGVCLNGQ